MHCNEAKNFGVKQKCKEFLAFSFQSCPEVRFLNEYSSYFKCQSKKLWDVSFSLENVLDHPLLSQNELTRTTERLHSRHCPMLDQHTKLISGNLR